MSILKRQHSCVWVAAAYKRSISNSKTVLNFCNKMDYRRVTTSSGKSSAVQYLVSGKFSNQNFAFPFRYLLINLAFRLFDQLLTSDAFSNFFRKSKGSFSTFP